MIINYSPGKMDLDGTAPTLSVTFHVPDYSLEFNTQKIAIVGKQQKKTIIPTEEDIIVHADPGFTGLSEVIVQKIPQNYGRVTYETGGILTIE